MRASSQMDIKQMDTKIRDSSNNSTELAREKNYSYPMFK